MRMDRHSADEATDRLARLLDPLHLGVQRDTFRWAELRRHVGMLRGSHLLARVLAPTTRAFGLSIAATGEAMRRFGAVLEEIQRTAPPASAAPGSRGRGPGG